MSKSFKRIKLSAIFEEHSMRICPAADLHVVEIQADAIGMCVVMDANRSLLQDMIEFRDDLMF